MKPEEVHGLLATAAMYDERDPMDHLAEWTAAAERFEWSFDETEAKIHDWYGSSTEFLVPADLKPDHGPGEGPNPTGEPASFETIDEAMAFAATKLGWTSSEVRRALLGVACRFCEAEGGLKCRRPTRTTGIGWMRVDYCHPCRYVDAGIPLPDAQEQAQAARTRSGDAVAPVT